MSRSRLQTWLPALNTRGFKVHPILQLLKFFLPKGFFLTPRVSFDAHSEVVDLWSYETLEWELGGAVTQAPKWMVESADVCIFWLLF